MDFVASHDLDVTLHTYKSYLTHIFKIYIIHSNRNALQYSKKTLCLLWSIAWYNARSWPYPFSNHV